MIQFKARTTLQPSTRLELVLGDITSVKTDAIVNAANRHLMHAGGVAEAIARKGGPTIQEESRRWIKEHGQVHTEAPAVTLAGNLPARFVIHAVGPIWGEGDEDAKLAAVVNAVLNTAEARGLECITLPAISTGIFGFPKRRAANTILASIDAYCNGNPLSSLRQIQIVIIDEATLKPFLAAFEDRWPESIILE
ncbi:MAG: macro domain-containing protein [Anaerolineales bacterium]|nr:macro domain-containing protein [Anaerolineales bacterium]